MKPNPRFAATTELQRPSGPPELPAHCPQCGRETETYLVSCDGHVFPVARCRAHGDVVGRPEGGAV